LRDEMSCRRESELLLEFGLCPRDGVVVAEGGHEFDVGVLAVGVRFPGGVAAQPS